MNAGLVAGAIGLGTPERALLLTQVGDDFDQVRNRIKRYRYQLVKRHRYRFDWVWHVEPNPAGTGLHVHGWQRGDFVPQRLLSSVAAGEGMGEFVRVSRVRQRVGAQSYGLKLVGVRYGLKLAEAEASMRSYLEVNGGRLCHSSRGYWLDKEGQPVGQREAMASWANVRGGRESRGRWELIKAADLDRALASVA